MNSLSVLALSVTRIHYEFYIRCSNLLWINSLFREFTMNSLLIKWIHYESIIFFDSFWIQRKISNRMVCISCAFGRVFDFRPQMTFFDPVRWPQMTLTCTESEWASNLQSIHMHIMHIRHVINIISILTPLMTLFVQKWPLRHLAAPWGPKIRILHQISHPNHLCLCRLSASLCGTKLILEILELKICFLISAKESQRSITPTLMSFITKFLSNLQGIKV